MIDKIIDRINEEQIRKGRLLALYEIKEILQQLLNSKGSHWVFGSTMGHEWMKCSNCCVSQFPNGCYTYCPNCGAYMSEEPEYEE